MITDKIYDKIYSVFLNDEIAIETKYELFGMIKPEWNHVERYRKIHDYIGKALSEKENPNVQTCAVYMKTNNLFNSAFSFTHLSELISAFNWDHLAKFNIYLNQIFEFYVIREMQIVTRDLGAVTVNPNPTIDKIRKILNKGIDLTQIEIQSKESNSDILDRVIEKHEKVRNGESLGLDLGFKSFREEVVLEDVDLMVIAARPSMGKTAFGVSLLIKLVFQQNEEVVFYALEMSKEQVMRRIVSQLTDIAGHKIKFGRLTNDELLKIKSIKRLPQWNNFEILEGSRTANEVYFETAKRHNRKPISCVIVDYLQKLKPERDGNKYQAVTFASNRMKELSQNLKIPVVALAQLSRGVEQRGGDRRPSLSDLRDSGEIEQDATVVAFLHRPEYYGFEIDENGESLKNKGEFIVAKNRDGALKSYQFSINPDSIKWIDENRTFEIEEMPNLSLNKSAGIGLENEAPF